MEELIKKKRKRKPFSAEHRLKLSLAGKGKVGYWRGKKHSIDHISKRTIKAKGENNFFWKGGVTPIKHRLRNLLEYKIWRKKVFERDNYTCVWCGDAKGGNLEADHIIPFSKIIEKLMNEYGAKNLFEKALTYEPLWDIANGRTLCKDCHKQTDTYGEKAKNYSPLMA